MDNKGLSVLLSLNDPKNKLTTTCHKCGTFVPLPSSPAAMANAVAAVERRGFRLCKKCSACSRVVKYNKTEKGKKSQKKQKSKPDQHARDLASTRAWRARMKAEGKTMDLNRKYNYGLTPEQYQEMCVKDPVCAICGVDNKPLVVDHDHGTEMVRGRLCVKCNTALGKFGDSPFLLNRALTYLHERS